MKDQKRKTVDRQPVSDGDTRPDKQPGQEKIIRSSSHVLKKEQEKLTKERAADTNTLEDFKDAK
jgi:hypothetical protein